MVNRFTLNALSAMVVNDEGSVTAAISLLLIHLKKGRARGIATPERTDDAAA